MELIASIDYGIRYTKTMRKEKFPSTLKKNSPASPNVESDSFSIEYNHQAYHIGGRNEVDYNTNINKSTYTDAKVLIIGALSKLITVEDEVKLITCIPPTQNSLANVERYKTLLRTPPNGMERVRTGKRDLTFRITEVQVFPECAAAFYHIPMNYNKVILIDLGGMTVNVAQFEYRKMISWGTYNKGTLALCYKLKQELNSEYQMEDDLLGVEFILENGLYGDPEGGEKIISRVINSHAEDIVREISMKFNLKAGQVVVTGGGALSRLGKAVNNRVNGEISETAEYDNVLGLHSIARRLWGA